MQPFMMALKMISLYLASFLASVGFYVYLSNRFRPKHQILNFPVVWGPDSWATVDLEGGQRVGGNFYMSQVGEGAILKNRNGFVFEQNFPYDISLLLKYPDRPEVSDLGNLKISLGISRRGEQEEEESLRAGTATSIPTTTQIETVRALRYETTVLRFCREVLSVPRALWRGEGSERTERIPLVKRFIDLKKPSKDLDFKDFLLNSSTGKLANPITKFKVKIDPMPPIHSLNLEIVANLSLLQNFLYYWPITTAMLIIGGSTAILWLLVTLYGLIELILFILELRAGGAMRQEKGIEGEDLNENEKNELQEEDIEQLIDIDIDVDVVSVEFPPADSVANFIGDLRQRKLLKAVMNDDEIIEDGSSCLFDSGAEAEELTSESEDQSVPNKEE